MKYEEALLKWGSTKLGRGATATSVDIDTETESGGYCESCAYESTYAGVRIVGKTAKGKRTETFIQNISLADILGEILALTE